MMRLSLPACRGFFTAVFVFVAGQLAAQPAAPRPLAHEDFDAWRGIFTPTLSRDGRWLAYSYMPQDGDGEVIVRADPHQKPVAAVSRGHGSVQTPISQPKKFLGVS